jgi:HEAT repeat protein
MSASIGFVPAALPRNLTAALRDIDSRKVQVRRSAARDLGTHVDSNARVQVVERLSAVAEQDPDTEVRVQAILALADGGATEAVAVLVQLANTAAPRVMQMALLALGELAQPGDPNVCSAAHRALGSELPALRYQGLVALRHISGIEAASTIATALGDPDDEVRWVTVRLLDELLQQIKGAGEAHDWALPLIPKLHAVLHDRNHRVAAAAQLLLARSGDVDAIRDLAVLLSANGMGLDRQDELDAIRLAARFRVQEAKPALQKRAWPLFFHTSVAFEARVALAHLGDSRAEQSILRDLRSSVASRCARAIEPVGLLRLLDGRARLIQLLESPERFDVEAVRKALQRLDG